jgi:hypothetical protein
LINSTQGYLTEVKGSRVGKAAERETESFLKIGKAVCFDAHVLSQNVEGRPENGNRRWHHCCSKRSNAKFLPDRAPSFRDAVRYIEQEFREATTFPIVVITIEQDTTGGALSKRKRTSGD